MDLQRLLDEFDRRDWQTAEEGTVRVAMVGLGRWVRDHAIPAVEASALCETTAVASSSREKAESVAAAAGVDRAVTYDELHDGAAADAYDAMYVCTPNATHLAFAETAADLGKHVLCEKPMEASVERAERLVEACAGSVELMVAYRMHTEHAVRRMRELVREGVVGDPVQVHGEMSQRLLDIDPNPDQWRLNPDLAGPGASVTDLGVYPLNTARFVLDADPVRVQALMRSAGDAFADVPDEWASFQIEYEGGVYAACSASQHAREGGRLTVVGTEGELTLEPAFVMDERRGLTVRREGASAEVAFDPANQMVEEFDYFADRLLTGGEIEADGEHGLVDMRAIEAVYEAGKTGETVRV